MTYDIIAIGASAGGIDAIRQILKNMKPDLPPIVIVQHIIPNINIAYTQAMGRNSAVEIFEANQSSLRLDSGCAVIAPADYHMTVKKDRFGYKAYLDKYEPIGHHRPSIDKLFFSVATEAKDRAIGIILTGMGQDGAEGLLAMHRNGAKTIAQDKYSSIVWSMPKAAIDKGAVDYILPLNLIPTQISNLYSKGSE